ncbi:MAG: hypothetical protein KJN76_09390 [Eudoraea sp.]|nr:hypothetical protein [Eudoraea sp.]
MKKKLLLTIVFLASATLVSAQKKSELLAEIAVLKSKLDSTESVVLEARKNERIGVDRAASFETQVKDLQEANATLLKNLNSFAEVSNKNSSAINQALASLEQKENQLKGITNSIASNDSTAIVVLTNTKQTLGEEAKIAVSNGAVIISGSLDMLFGGSSNAEVDSAAEAWLGKVAAILKAHPQMMLTIEGLTMTGELHVAAAQANAIATLLQKNHEIDPGRIVTLGKDGNFKEGVNLKLHPNYLQFYLMVKEDMKNGS